MLKGHADWIACVAFDGSGKYLASGGGRGVTCDGDGYGDRFGALGHDFVASDG